jgi:hypothetical protein
LHYLIAEGYIKRLQADDEIIIDEKTDDVDIIVQTLWVVFNCITRAVQKLAVIELNVYSFITNTMPVVYFCSVSPLILAVPSLSVAMLPLRRFEPMLADHRQKNSIVHL